MSRALYSPPLTAIESEGWMTREPPVHHQTHAMPTALVLAFAVPIAIVFGLVIRRRRRRAREAAAAVRVLDRNDDDPQSSGAETVSVCIRSSNDPLNGTRIRVGR
jgi:hypothetical protein